MLEHGGQLRHAMRQYGIAMDDWLDLSTGINPDGWPAPPLPPGIWQHLPQDDDELHAAAQAYYGAKELLAVAGSQAAIQALPQLRPTSRVALATPAYAEHALAWQRHGHTVTSVPVSGLLRAAADAEVAVVINPNNPTGEFCGTDELLELHAQLAAKGGWLVVDEAFMDATPDCSLAPFCPRPGLIVLRSLGKFFGLSGARVGFVLTENAVLQPLAELLGPWPLAAPSRWIATQALRDTAWQEATRKALPLAAQRLASLLNSHGLSPSGGCSLFQWVRCADAASMHEQLAHRGILTRLFRDPPSLRFGLPCGETQWTRLDAALKEIR